MVEVKQYNNSKINERFYFHLKYLIKVKGFVYFSVEWRENDSNYFEGI